jgi:hypothetical protein
MLVVLLNNKLITCDTIVPLLVELHAKNPEVRVEFATFEQKTFDIIKQNLILYEAINSMGQLTLRGRSDKGRKSRVRSLRERFATLGWLTALLAKAWLGRATIIHFKSLNRWPLRWFGSLAAKRVVFMEPSAIGYAPLEKRASDLMKSRTYTNEKPVGRYVVGFSDHWPPLSDARLEDNVKIRLNAPFTSRHWTSFLDDRRERYIRQSFAEVDASYADNFALYILTWFGPSGLLRNRNSFPDLFEETLAAYAATCPHLPLFIKPHPVMTADERRWVFERARSFPELTIVPTDLHPMLLARSARFAVGNCYSTVFSVLCHMHVPTIEYTEYADQIRLETGNGSIRPEYVTVFVDRNPEELRSAFSTLSERKPRQAERADMDVLTDPALTAVLSGGHPRAACH